MSSTTTFSFKVGKQVSSMPDDYFVANLSALTVNSVINDAIERTAVAKSEPPRPYLGASGAGHECLRRVQYDWWCKPVHPALTREKFARGNYFETRVRQQLLGIGFKLTPPEALAFTAMNGDFRGHADGVVIGGPNPLDGVYLNYPFVWECKAIKQENWRKLAKHGLEKTFSYYSAQVSLYQAYLDLTNPALFSAVNANTCELLHFWVPFEAARAQYWSDRVANIVQATRAGELLARAYDSSSDWRCKMCPHKKRCWR